MLSSVGQYHYNTFERGVRAEEAISGHFAGAILPQENEEFQKTLLPFIYALFKYKIKTNIGIYL